MTDGRDLGILGRHPIVAFVALTYVISWVIWVGMMTTFTLEAAPG
jgi:hypothetical protein